MQSKINGLQQSVENVQTGTNLLTVADGAAATIQGILQRIDSLIIESNSDINSNTQLMSIQAEIGQALLEINRISQNANFNGITLFDGSHDTYVADPNTNIVTSLANAGIAANGNVSTPYVANSMTSSNLMIDISPAHFKEAGGQIVTGLFVFQLSQYDSTTNTMNLTANLYSTDSSFGAAPESIQQNPGVPVNTGPDLGGGLPLNYSLPSGYGLTFDLANLSPHDAGPVSEAIFVQRAQASGGGTALNINDGGNEGSTIAISLPTLSTSALQISDISVLRPDQVDYTNTPTGQDQSNQWAAMQAQLAVGSALETVAALRAQLGAQMVATADDANNATVTALNLTSSASSITDLSIGTAVTQFTQAQILSSIGTGVLSQMQVDAKGLTNLMISALR